MTVHLHFSTQASLDWVDSEASFRFSKAVQIVKAIFHREIPDLIGYNQQNEEKLGKFIFKEGIHQTEFLARVGRNGLVLTPVSREEGIFARVLSYSKEDPSFLGKTVFSSVPLEFKVTVVWEKIFSYGGHPEMAGCYRRSYLTLSHFLGIERSSLIFSVFRRAAVSCYVDNNACEIDAEALTSHLETETQPTYI